MANHNSIKIKLESLRGRAKKLSHRRFPFRRRGKGAGVRIIKLPKKTFFSKERMQKPSIQVVKGGIKNTENQYTIDALA